MNDSKTIKNPKRSRALSIYDKLMKKEQYHVQKSHCARKMENIDFHFSRYKVFHSAANRARHLIYRMDSKNKFGDGRNWWEPTAAQWTERRNKAKEERRQKFESTYHIALHFMQNSLSADYGTFHCDSCECKFYHSPSDVYLGSVKLHSNCCGYCVNTLLSRNGQEELFF